MPVLDGNLGLDLWTKDGYVRKELSAVFMEDELMNLPRPKESAILMMYVSLASSVLVESTNLFVKTSIGKDPSIVCVLTS